MTTELYLIAPPDAPADPFAEVLRAVLAAADVAALLLPRGGRTEAEYVDFVERLNFMAQNAGCAVLIEGEPRLAIDLGVDGLHVEGPPTAVKAAIAVLKPDLIVGTGGIESRHDAMAKGELGVDYIMFGPLSGAIAADVRDLAGWWAETMEIPSVLSDPEAMAETAEAGGCEFLALGDSFWRVADPAATIAAIAARLESSCVTRSVVAALAALSLLLAPPALAAKTKAPIPLPTPSRGAPTPAADAAPAKPAGANQQQDAQDISTQVFGPRLKVDQAYGAYQRGAYLTALAFALPRAQQNDPAAETLIGEIYANGEGVAEDDSKAAGWFNIASRHGDMLAAFELALLYQAGKGVPKDGKRAAELFTQAAKSGYMPAKYNLALLYMDGLNVEPDLVKAAGLMKEAADSGLAEAQYDYGTMLMEGGGVLANDKQGAAEIGLAAKAGNIAAQVDYATLLYLGEGVPRDLAGAIRWYKQAADAGNAVAQDRYGKLLAVGEGVDLDLQQAAMWRALARRQGLNDPMLDKLLVSIPADDLAKAEELARFWPSTPPANAAPAQVGSVAPGNGGTPGRTLPTPAEQVAPESSTTAASAAATPAPQQSP